MKTVKSHSALSALEEEDETSTSTHVQNRNSLNKETNNIEKNGSNQNFYRSTYLPTFSTSVSWAKNNSRQNSLDFETENQPQNHQNPKLENSGRTESTSNLRRSSLARRISKVGSDLVSTAAEVAANSKIIRPPKLGDIFKGKQISFDLGALSFDATEKNIDVEEALNQRIKAITGEL